MTEHHGPSPYRVRARRAGQYWELHIDGVGVTQARDLETEADEMIRSYVAMSTGVAEDSVAYTLAAETRRGRIAELTRRTARISAGLNRRLAGK